MRNFLRIEDHLFEDLEDEVINFIEVGANLVPPPSLFVPAEIDNIYAPQTSPPYP